MQNFLTNAVRYTREGGILVGVRRRGENWRIDVIDSGVGIAADKVDAVFGEFTRLGDVEVEGLGLGLALVQRIARLLGGRVSVASKPGRGSRFSFGLPVAVAATATPARTSQPVGAPARQLAVLVIDNDPLIVEATSALLKGLGHRPLGASGMDEALGLCGEADAVLADYQLDAGEDGLTVIEAIWQTCPGLPARLITAESGAAMKERARLLGVPVLAKPVDPEKIERFLAEASMVEV